MMDFYEVVDERAAKRRVKEVVCENVFLFSFLTGIFVVS
jgi:hypothetical protein